MFLPSNITLKFGDSGDFVAELQRRLSMVGCFPEDGINGYFDGLTVNGVTSFQGREGLHADGVAGPETLRRLNGVIAGDTSSAAPKEEETAKEVAASQPLVNDMLGMHTGPAPAEFFGVTPSHSPYGADAYTGQQQQAAVTIAPAIEQTPQPQAAIPEDQQRLAAQAQRDAVLMAQQTFAPIPEAQQYKPEPQPQQKPPEQPLHKAEAKPEAGKESLEGKEPPAEAKGIVGRAKQFANAMVQKLSDYFEAKLPPSVLKEVQSIGIAMAQSGMKEAPIPSGPELPSRAPELPQRGPEQGQQRA